MKKILSLFLLVSFIINISLSHTSLVIAKENAYSYNGHTYKLFDTLMTWNEAKQACEDIGGHLATFTTQAEWKYIYQYIANNREKYWLGGNDTNNEGKWVWITGESWSYTDWCNNEPNNDYSGTEDYLGTYTSKNQWNDYREDEKLGFICEWDKSVSSNAVTYNDIDISGKYVGTYTAAQGLTGLTLNIYKFGEGYRALFTFYPDKSNPNVATGSYNCNVEYDKDTGECVINGTDWINKPSTYSFVKLSGYIKSSTFCGSVDDNWSFSLVKEYANNYFANKNVLKYNNNITVILNGKKLSFSQYPYIENGTTRVPMRTIFEALDSAVDYDANTKTITVRKGSTIIKLVTGASTATINGREMKLAASVENKNGSTMVPLRFVSEALGAEVIWDGETKTITINLAEDKAYKEHLVNNPITGHSNVILTIYDNRNNISDGIMWTTANWTDSVKHLINIEEEAPDVKQGKGVLASILANVPKIESEPVDTSKYTDISDLVSDGISIVEDYFGTSAKETKLLKNSIKKLGDVIDWTAFSIEEIDFLLRDYKKNIQYFVLLQSNCNDEYVNAIINDLMQDYTDKWYKTIIDVNEKITDEVVDKGIDASAGFYTAGLYPVVKYSSELISTTTGLKSKTDTLADFYQVCRMINPVDETLEKCLIKYKNGECSESDLQAAFELNKATKIYAYECITKFGKLSDVDKAYENIQDVKQYILKDGKIVYCGGAGGGSMGGR